MKKTFLLLALAQGLPLLSQYTYFNNAYLDVPESGSVHSGIFCRDDGYVGFGSSILAGTPNLQFRILSSEGILEQDISLPSDSAIYIGGNYGISEYEEGYLWAGTYSTSVIDNIGAVKLFDHETLQPAWTRLFTQLNDSMTASIMCSARRMNDGTIWCGGFLQHNIDGDSWYEEYSTYLCHLDLNGELIEDWEFYTDNQNYWITEIYELDNGKFLLGAWHHINEILDHAVLLFNSETGQIEDEEIWGSQWDESSNILRRMPDGNFCVIYDSITWSDGEIVWALVEEDCLVSKVNTETLEFDWTMEIPLPDLDETSYGIGVVGFEATLDNGYIFCYNHVPIDQAVDGEYSDPHLVKLNSDFEVEWIKEYEAPTEYIFKGISDMDIACDGGYICTGLVFTPENQQRQWTFKTDACGELEAMGCPPVGVEEQIVNTTLQLWPNPAGETLYFGMTEGYSVESYQVFDAKGRCCMTDNLTANQIDVSQLRPGLFSVVLYDAEGRCVLRKFVKE